MSCSTIKWVLYSLMETSLPVLLIFLSTILMHLYMEYISNFIIVDIHLDFSLSGKLVAEINGLNQLKGFYVNELNEKVYRNTICLGHRTQSPDYENGL